MLVRLRHSANMCSVPANHRSAKFSSVLPRTHIAGAQILLLRAAPNPHQKAYSPFQIGATSLNEVQSYMLFGPILQRSIVILNGQVATEEYTDTETFPGILKLKQHTNTVCLI